MSDLMHIEHGELVIYDPEKGLKEITVSEAAEKHWRRAKDATKLYAAIEAKIGAQAEYVVWRDHVTKLGRPKKNGPSAATILPDDDPGKRVVERWRSRLCTNGKADDEKIKRATIIDADKVARALEDAGQRCQRICEQQNANTIRGTEGTGEFERYTPARYIEAARLVLGEIDLDPATSKQAQQIVRALQYYTEKDDGLEQEWSGRVFLNPPYHRDLAPKFIKKLIAEVSFGRTTAAILLTNNCTDTEWFLAAAQACNAICFTNGRIKFTTPKGDEVLPTQGQSFLYFGGDPQRFEDVFCVIGFCVRPSRQYELRDVNWHSMAMERAGNGGPS